MILSACAVKVKIAFTGTVTYMYIHACVQFDYSNHCLLYSTFVAYHRNQRFYAAPAINQMYEKRQKDILISPEFQGRQLVVCGDSRMDSPGFSATKATYSFMEHDSNIVLHMEHGDKRQVCCVYHVHVYKYACMLKMYSTSRTAGCTCTFTCICMYMYLHV